jgi:hypothetical protein
MASRCAVASSSTGRRTGRRCPARARHAVLQHLDGLLRDLLDAGALAVLLAGDRHVGLQHDAFERDALVVELLELRLERPRSVTS